MIGRERLAAGERAEAAGDYVTATAAYRAVSEAEDETLAADAFYHLGRVTWRQGRFVAALALFEKALLMAERLGDRALSAQVGNGVGAVHHARGDYAAARHAYLLAQEQADEPAMRGRIMLNLGVIESSQDNHVAARSHYDEAFRLCQAAGDRTSEADLEQWAEADASFVAALALATEGNDVEMIAKALLNRSEVLVEQGALAEAVEHCQRALAIYDDIGDEVGRGEALRWRAHALGRAGDRPAAERDAREALQIAVRSGARLLEAEAARDLGVLLGLLGDRTNGGKQLHRALALFTELGARREATDVASLLRRPTPARSLERIDEDP
jgi:tetratricopeptide (TPR) repeat protein